MTKDEALKLALEAMTYADACLKKQLTTKDKHEYAQDLLLEAGTAIKEALANVATNDTSQERVDKTSESVHEPVSIQRWPSAAIGKETLQDALKRENTTPPQRKPLTDAQSERLYRNIEPSRQQDARSLAAFKRLLRVIEAAHGIKGEA